MMRLISCYIGLYYVPCGPVVLQRFNTLLINFYTLKMIKSMLLESQIQATSPAKKA